MAAPASPASFLLTASPSPRGAGNRVSGITAAPACCLGSHDRGRTAAALHVGRRQSLLLLSLSTPFAFGLAPATADDIPLFGLRKKLRTIEQGAEEILREGEKAVEQGIEAAEREIQATEKEIQVAEKEIGAAAAGAATGLELGLGSNLAQAGAVAAAEVVGVLVAFSVVNGILGPEGRRS